MGWEEAHHCQKPMTVECYPNNNSCGICEYRRNFDGNDMVLVMNKLQEKEHWENFYYDRWVDFIPLQVKKTGVANHQDFTYWLMQPERFFDLMEQVLKEEAIIKVDSQRYSNHKT
jgi:hypothetical protein